MLLLVTSIARTSSVSSSIPMCILRQPLEILLCNTLPASGCGV